LGGILGIPNYRSQAFRPPGGFLTPPVKKVVRQKGLKLVPISFYAVDTLYRVDNYQTVVKRVLQDARQKRGGIYVLHDGRDPLWGNERTALEPKHGLDRSWIPRGVAQIVDELTKEEMVFLNPTDFFKAASF
jgi:peptidoglycan/xylan/chitin deacetylase (PgdA/CDA1 family)